MISEQSEDVYSPYCNKEQFKTKTLATHKFRVPKKYRLHCLVGCGGYGVVCAGVDQTLGKPVAIKKINQMECSRNFLKRILREMKILRNIGNINAIRLIDVVLPESRSAFQDLYLVFQMCDTDLGVLIKNRKLTLKHVQFFSARIIFDMLCLHKQGILHRDLKPQNILVNKNNDLKICDFGLSRVVQKEDLENGLTDYVFTRYYRAPELLVGISKYTEAVDIWSIGCVIAEMLMGTPLFRQQNCKLQLEKIISFCGLQLDDVISYDPFYQQFFLQNYPMGDGNNKFLFDICPEGADLVTKILKLDPTQRISLDDALMHPFVAEYAKQFVVPPTKQINPLEFQFQKKKLTPCQLKDLIYEEILLYHFPEFSKAYMSKLEKKGSVISHVRGDSGTTMEMEQQSMEYHF